MMRVAAELETGHEAVIHDVAYDYYGRRMASVSSDQRVKVGECVCEWWTTSLACTHSIIMPNVVVGV